jgi:glutathione S-transferase
MAGQDYVLGRFTAADILLTTVLRTCATPTWCRSAPALAPIRIAAKRAPRFQKALADQIAGFERNAPPAA